MSSEQKKHHLTRDELSKKYAPFNLAASYAVFLQNFLTTMIETRPGAMKASECMEIGAIHNALAEYIQKIVNHEEKEKSQKGEGKQPAAPTERKTKENATTDGLPKPKAAHKPAAAPTEIKTKENATTDGLPKPKATPKPPAAATESKTNDHSLNK